MPYAALDWVAAHAVLPAVVMMSLGVTANGAWSRALAEATHALVDKNITAVVASGVAVSSDMLCSAGTALPHCGARHATMSVLCCFCG